MTTTSPPPPELESVPAHWKRNVALFLSGQTVSLFGSMVVQYAVMWYVTLETRSGRAVATYAVAAFAPQGLMSIFGGVLADRINRKKLVMVADAGIALVTLALALLMMSVTDDLWVIYVAVAIRSVGAGIQTPTVQALIPQIVPGEHLMRVNGIFQTIASAMALLAPAVAAAIYAGFGLVPIFFLDVVTAAMSMPGSRRLRTQIGTPSWWSPPHPSAPSNVPRPATTVPVDMNSSYIWRLTPLSCCLAAA